MDLCLKIFLVVVGLLFIQFPLQSFDLDSLVQDTEQSNLVLKLLAQSLDQNQAEQQLYAVARSITVKVLSHESWGSGILIQKQGNVYTVLTNAHVLNQSYGNLIRIQTPDGKIYVSQPVKEFRRSDNDLALVSFHSSEKYSIASLYSSPLPSVGDNVFASGFPFETERPQGKDFMFTQGQVKSISNKAFAQGYQFGFTNLIKVGMSGGPLLNSKGKVIGINGLQANPLWGNPYVFSDGSIASGSIAGQMSQLSWAIPIQAFLQIDSGFSNASTQPPSNSQVSPVIERQSSKILLPITTEPSGFIPPSEPRLW